MFSFYSHIFFSFRENYRLLYKSRCQTDLFEVCSQTTGLEGQFLVHHDLKPCVAPLTLSVRTISTVCKWLGNNLCCCSKYLCIRDIILVAAIALHAEEFPAIYILTLFFSLFDQMRNLWLGRCLLQRRNTWLVYMQLQLVRFQKKNCTIIETGFQQMRKATMQH